MEEYENGSEEPRGQPLEQKGYLRLELVNVNVNVFILVMINGWLSAVRIRWPHHLISDVRGDR
jgi:hypothetical protein